MTKEEIIDDLQTWESLLISVNGIKVRTSHCEEFKEELAQSIRDEISTIRKRIADGLTNNSFQ